MAEAANLLVHIRQRLDALSYKNDSLYTFGLLQPSSLPPPLFPSHVSFQQFRAPSHAVYTTSLSHPTSCSSWLQYVGLTAFYMRLVLLLGFGWTLNMVSSFIFLYTLFSALNDEIMVLSTAQVIVLLELYFLGGAIGSIACGLCADYFGRKPVVLCALSFCVIITAFNTGAWNYTSFVILRLLSGICIGGQLPLFAILALEYTPTKTRGKLTLLTISMAGIGVFGGIGYGQLVFICFETRELRWRITYGALTVIALFFLVVFYRVLEESPKYLACVGRTQEAFRILTKIEMAHGINRHARVTVPTSLYEPPSQHTRMRTERHENSYSGLHNVDSDMTGSQSGQDEAVHEELQGVPSFDYVGPGAAKARSQSQCALARRLQSQRQIHADLCTQSSDIQERDSHGLGSSVNATFYTALSCRIAVLFSRPLAARTVTIWFYWFVQLMSISAAIVTLLMMARTFTSVNQFGTTFSLTDQLFWSAMAFPGLLFAAMMVETIGRRGTLALFALCGGAIMIVSALMLEEDGDWIDFSLALGAIVLTTGGTLGALISFTGEQFPLLTRALGLSSASAWGHLGMFTGLYFVLHRVMGDEAWSWYNERVILAVCGGVSIALLPVILLMGPETRGRDIDVLCFESNEALQALAVMPGGRCEQPTVRYCGLDKDSSNRGKKDVDKRAKVFDDNEEKEVDSPVGCGSIRGLAAFYSPSYEASATAHARRNREFCLYSLSPMSNAWQPESVCHSSHKTNHRAQLMAHLSDEKQVVSFACDHRQTNDRRMNSDDRRNMSLPMDVLNQFDCMIIECDSCQPESLLDTMLPEWRHFLLTTQSEVYQNLSGSRMVDRQEHNDNDDDAASEGLTENGRHTNDIDMGRYTIELDMFDTFTYISTPVLGGGSS